MVTMETNYPFGERRMNWCAIPEFKVDIEPSKASYFLYIAFSTLLALNDMDALLLVE